MPLENLKISEDRSKILVKTIQDVEKTKEVKILDETIALKTDILANNIIAWLENTKLATFIETQFKSGDKWKSFAELTADPMYVFAVQSSLDALGYDALLTGGDAGFGIDEKYWSRTKNAVTKFQENVWLTKKDGLVWEETFAALVGKLKDPTFKPNLSESIATDAVDKSKTVVDTSKIVLDAKGKVLVDSYGNSVTYVSSITEIPVDKFNTDAWWKNIYAINGYQIYGNGRVLEKKTNKMYNWADIKDKITATAPNQPSALADNEPFGSKTFDGMVSSIQSDIIDKLGKEKQWYFVSLVDKKDPLFSVKISKDSYNKSIIIDLNAYQNDTGLDKVKMKQYIVSMINSVKEESDKKKEKDKKMGDRISSIGGSTYTIDKLFPDLKWKKLAQYNSFFSTFDNNILTIDNYTMLDSEKKNILLTFDQTWRNSTYVSKIKIPVEKIFDADGNPKPDAEQLKVLSEEVKKIIEDPKNGYVA